jgi:hypothetical protein
LAVVAGRVQSLVPGTVTSSSEGRSSPQEVAEPVDTLVWAERQQAVVRIEAARWPRQLIVEFVTLAGWACRPAGHSAHHEASVDDR